MNRLAIGLVGLLLALPTSRLAAHIVLERPEASVGSPYKAVLSVPHGCAGSPTIRLTVSIPEGLIAIKPMPKPGWTLETVKGAYPRPYEFMHGAMLSEGVRQIIWSGGRLEDDFYDEFVFTGFVAASLKAGDTLALPVVQDCERGVANWTGIAAPGQDPHQLKSPAPLLRLAAGQRSAALGGNGVAITQPWSRATPAGTTTGAAYLTIRNNGPERDRLIGVSSPIARKVEVHEMTTANGVMMMRPLDHGLMIEAGQSVTLSPGGFHLMLSGLSRTLAAGGAFPLALEFERAGAMTATVEIRDVGAQSPAETHSSAGGHDHGAMAR